MWKMGKRLIKMFMKCFVNSNKSSTFAPAIENDALLAQLVEQLTLNQWVQGSKVDALLAQLVEQLTLNQWVQGSNP